MPLRPRHPFLAALLVPAVLAVPCLASAAVPHGLTEQGRLFDAAGSPLDGTVTLTFTLYDAASGGNALWTEAQIVTLDEGYFSAELGALVPIPTGVWTGAERYVGIKVGNDPEMSPRQSTRSVPYALVAGDAVGDIHPTTVSVNGQLVIDAQGNWVGPATGLVGPAGPAGPTGAQGIAGPQGPAGPIGPAGATGPQGPAGSTGAQGPQGVAGPTGADGPQGAVGPTGPAGAGGGQVPSAASPPAAPTLGTFYYDTTLAQLRFYDGAQWLAITGAQSPTDPSFASVKLLLHVENSAVDVIGNPVNNSGVTFSGPAARFGSYGAVFNGNAYLSVGASGVFAIGLSDFTVEAWVQSNTNAADTYYRRIFMTDGPTGNAAGNFQIAIVPSTGRVNLWDGGALDLIGTSNVTDGLWHHVAATRQQGTLRLFVDGALQGSIAYNVSITPVASPRPWIGAYTASWGRFVGNMDDVRVTVGVARYTAAFTPPSAQFPDH